MWFYCYLPAMFASGLIVRLCMYSCLTHAHLVFVCSSNGINPEQDFSSLWAALWFLCSPVRFGSVLEFKAHEGNSCTCGAVLFTRLLLTVSVFRLITDWRRRCSPESPCLPSPPPSPSSVSTTPPSSWTTLPAPTCLKVVSQLEVVCCAAWVWGLTGESAPQTASPTPRAPQEELPAPAPRCCCRPA